VWRRGKDASSERREGGTDTGHVHRLRPLLRPILVRRQQSPGSHKLGRPRGTRGCHPISKKNPPKRREREGVVCESACGARVGGSRRRSKLCGADGQPARDPQFSRRPLGREARKSQVGDKGPQHSTPRRPRGRGKSWFARLRCPGFTWQTSGTMARGRRRSPLGALAQAP
jgi:hypothetical protein